MLKWLKNKLHIHCYIKPIASQYWTFSTRRIFYQCRCGKTIDKLVYRDFGDSFPIATNCFMSDKEFNELLNNNK